MKERRRDSEREREQKTKTFSQSRTTELWITGCQSKGDCILIHLYVLNYRDKKRQCSFSTPAFECIPAIRISWVLYHFANVFQIYVQCTMYMYTFSSHFRENNTKKKEQQLFVLKAQPFSRLITDKVSLVVNCRSF